MERSKFIEQVTPYFIQHGYKTLRVEEISKLTGFSLKSIYNMFPGKSSIISSVLNHRNKLLLRMGEEIKIHSTNAVHNYILLMLKSGEFIPFEQQLENLHQLQKFYPEHYQDNLIELKNIIASILDGIVIRGQEEGFFRLIDQRISVELGTLNYLNLIIPNFLSPDFKFDPELHKKALIINFVQYLRSILTTKGHQQLKLMQPVVEHFMNNTPNSFENAYRELADGLWPAGRKG
ncbi:MAG: TetR/AcrR family transcriptional regulator [Flavobacteriaceae bacterium]|nr:TetR/AcrR family transcriptional regulator [Flavobacteriaceae bacterium]